MTAAAHAHGMRVFISYARADDEPFVERLQRDLDARGVAVWWDRDAMSSRGRTFLQELRDAIEGSDRVLAIVGPHAVASRYVRVEWDHALMFSKGILPVLREGDGDLLPPELRLLHWVDFRATRKYDDALAELCKKLAEPVEPLGPLRTPVPMAPPHVQPRRDEVEAIGSFVLADVKRPTVVPVGSQAVVLSGMVGVGKSVLAALFARAVETRRAFFDGVLWLSYGREPDLPRILRTLGAALEDDVLSFVDETAAVARIPSLLSDRACLIVADDVWDPRHVAPVYSALGPRCRLLLTTRLRDIAPALGAPEQRVDLLSDDLSLALLADWSGQPLTALPAEAREIVRECGNLPLALAMAGAMVGSRPGRWANVLHKLRRTDLDAISQRFPDYPHPSLLRAIDVSVEELDEFVRDRFVDLAVFPEDTPVPLAALATYWAPVGLDPFETEDVVDALVRRSLAELRGSDAIELHDLVFDYVRRRAEDLTALDGRLLDSYRTLAAHGDWWELPDDGYIYDHLVRHLERHGDRDEVHRLLLGVDGGQPAWWRAREHAGQTAGFLADVARAWKMADEDLSRARGSPLIAVERQVRYALMHASVATRAAGVPVRLLDAALARGVLSVEAAAGIARQHLDVLRDVTGLVAVARHASGPTRDELLGEALDIAREVEPLRRPDALAVVASGADRELKAHILAEALRIVSEAAQERDEVSDYRRASGLEALAPVLTPDLFPIAVEEVARLTDFRSMALVALVPHAPETVAERLVELAGGLQWARERVAAFTALFEHLPTTRREPALRHALASALEAGEVAGGYGASLDPVAPHLTPDLLRDALAAVLALREAEHRADGLAALASALPMGLLEHALRACWETLDGDVRAWALAHVVPYLDEEHRASQVGLAFREIGEHLDGEYIAAALVVLAPALTGAVLEQAVATAHSIEDPGARASALLALRNASCSRGLDDAIVESIHGASRRAISSVPIDLLTDDDLTLWRVLLARFDEWPMPAEMLARVPAALSEEALELVSTRSTSQYRMMDYLGALASQLPDALLLKSLAMVPIDDRDAQRTALLGLLDKLPPARRRLFENDLLERARAIADPEEQARSLARATRYVNKPEAVWEEAVAAIDQASARARREYLPAIAGWLPDSVLPLAVAFAAALRDSEAQVRALSSLGADTEAMAIAERLDNATLRVELMAKSGTVDVETVRAVLENKSPDALLSEHTLLRLARFVDADTRAALVHEAFWAFITEDYPDHVVPDQRLQWFTSLPFELPPAALEFPHKIALEVADPVERAAALTRLAAQAAPPSDASIAGEVLELAATELTKTEAIRALAGIAQWLPPDRLTDTMGQAMALPDPTMRAAALADMLPAVQPPARDEIAVQALAAIADWRDDNLGERVLRACIRVADPTWLSDLLAALERVPTPEVRAGLAAELVAKLPADTRDEAIAVGLRAAASALHYDTIARLGRESEALPPGAARQLWIDVLHPISRQARSWLLLELPELAPLAAAATGSADEVRRMMIEAIRTCTGWWP